MRETDRQRGGDGGRREMHSTLEQRLMARNEKEDFDKLVRLMTGGGGGRDRVH